MSDSVLSLHRLFQDAQVQRLIGDELLELPVLLFQVLETAQLIGLQAAVLVTPTMISGFTDRQLLAHFAERAPGTEFRFRLAQLADDLLQCMS